MRRVLTSVKGEIMEALSALQDKVEKLIKLVQNLKNEKSRLEKENKQLLKKIESITCASENTATTIQELGQEKAQTKMILEDVIKTIDSFISVEQ